MTATVAAALIAASMETLMLSGAADRMTQADGCPYLLAIERDAPELRAAVDIPNAAWNIWVDGCALREDRGAGTEDRTP